MTPKLAKAFDQPSGEAAGERLLELELELLKFKLEFRLWFSAALPVLLLELLRLSSTGWNSECWRF